MTKVGRYPRISAPTLIKAGNQAPFGRGPPMQNKAVLMLAAASLLLAGLPACAAELKVFVGGAMTETVEKIGADFAKRSGNKLDYVSDTTGALQKRLAAGEKADVVVVTAAGLDALQKENR